MNVEDNRIIYKSELLDECLGDADNAIIYGIGEYGSVVVDYIISAGKKEKIKGIVVTDQKDAPEAYKNIPVSEAESCFQSEENRKCLVIVALSVQYQADVITLLESYGIKRFCCLIRDGYLDLIKNGDRRPVIPYRGLDFLVAGFFKCGTTSLHRVLRGIDSIFVPIEKETHFFWWFDKVENAEEKLVGRYFSNIREGQKAVGAVEPSFYPNAGEIYQYFGPSVRIILIMRNPVEAAFSLYKMDNRCGLPVFGELYQKYGVYHEEMFEKYFEEIVKSETYPFCYDYWLEKFYGYFPREKVHVVFFEDLIKFPERELSCILKFIGIDEKHIVSKIPKANEGNYVMKNLEGYRIAKQKNELHYLWKHSYSVEKVRGGGTEFSLWNLKGNSGKQINCI